MAFDINDFRGRTTELKLVVCIALAQAMREEREFEAQAAVAALAEAAVEYALRLGGKRFAMHILKDLTDQVRRSKMPAAAT